MKLTPELKQKIDNFFDNIEPEELYRISVEKYGFIEEEDVTLNLELDNISFDTIERTQYPSKSDERSSVEEGQSISLAA
jgi:hypothetical protein